MRRQWSVVLLSASVMLAVGPPCAHAVIVADGDGRNTSPPPAPDLAAWNLEGQFGAFLATPIDNRHIIAAAHVGGPAPFVFQGHTYSLSSNSFAVPGTDLRVWTLDTTNDPTVFPTWAPLWNANVDGSEVGHQLTVFGRGVQRGSAIYAPINPGTTLTPNYSVGGTAVVPTSGSIQTSAAAATSSYAALTGPAPSVPDELHGWNLGSYDGAMSWGRNTVDAVETDPNLGTFLVYDFDRPDSPDAVEHEGGLSPYDSSGGVFIYSNGQWKLAGVNYGVDGIYAETPDRVYSSVWGDGYTRTAIVDVRGLYTITADGPDADSLPDVVQTGYADGPVGSQSYSTAVSPYTDYILSQIASSQAGAVGGGVLAPEPASLASLAGVAWLTVRRRR